MLHIVSRSDERLWCHQLMLTRIYMYVNAMTANSNKNMKKSIIVAKTTRQMVLQ